MEIAARHPAWWGQASDEESLNAHEGELLTEQLEELVGRPVPVRYEKVFSSGEGDLVRRLPDRKSTRLNSSHLVISYAVFCLKKKKTRLVTTKKMYRSVA